METLNDIEIEQEGTGRKIKARIVKIKNTNKYRVYVQGRRKPFIYQRKDGDTDADIRRNYVHIINKLLSFIKPRKRTPPKPKARGEDAMESGTRPRGLRAATDIAKELPGTQETIINQLRLRELERDNAEKDKTVAQNEVQKAISKIEALKQQKIEKIKKDKEGIDENIRNALKKGDDNREFLAYAIPNIPEFADDIKGLRFNPTASKTRYILKNGERIKDDELKALITPEKLKLIHEYIINKKGPIAPHLINRYIERLNTEYKLYNNNLTDDDESLRMPLLSIPNIQTEADKGIITTQDKKKAEEDAATAQAREVAQLEAQAAAAQLQRATPPATTQPTTGPIVSPLEEEEGDKPTITQLSDKAQQEKQKKELASNVAGRHGEAIVNPGNTSKLKGVFEQTPENIGTGITGKNIKYKVPINK